MAKRKPGKGPTVNYPAEKPKPKQDFTAGKGAKARTGKSRSWQGC